ncbi:uncharacterized protein LOC112083056 [Eutrema salsugineum]|uniref:uncharacterized protein LOC112083056 n=1 Tax=Eutrema salsugineum TaxID=72664 RepID=UPI000CED2437|nr:uncharacterized protein LOC112083056 [Eutrema salsugineum]
MHLKGMQLLDTIDKSKTISEEKKAKALIFLFHHIYDGLKDEYITKEDPTDLWQSLQNRFDHQTYVILPKARHEWLNLCFKITRALQQYRAKGYKKYSELMQVLLVAEQNNELVMLNHQSRPTGSAPLPEVNVASSNANNWQQGQGLGHGNNRGHGRGYGRGRGRGCSKRLRSNYFTNGRNNKRNEDGQEMNKQYDNTTCYRCDIKGHWSHFIVDPEDINGKQNN